MLENLPQEDKEKLILNQEALERIKQEQLKENKEVSPEMIQKKIQDELQKIENYSEQVTEIPDRQEKQITELGGDPAIIEEKLKPEFNVLKSIRENVSGRFAKVAAILGLVGSLNMAKAENGDNNSQTSTIQEIKNNLSENKEVHLLYEEAVKNPKVFLEHVDLFIESAGKDSVSEEVRKIAKNQPGLFILNAYRLKNLFPEDLGGLINSTIESSGKQTSFSSVAGTIIDHIEDYKNIPGIDMNIFLQKVFSYRSELIIKNIDKLEGIPNFDRISYIQKYATGLSAVDILINLSSIQNIEGINVPLLVSKIIQENPTVIFDQEISSENLKMIDEFGVDIQTVVLKNPLKTVQSDLLERMKDADLLKSAELKKFYEIIKAVPYSYENKDAYVGVLINQVLSNNISLEDLKKAYNNPSSLFKVLAVASKDSADLGITDIEQTLSNVALKNIENINELHEAGDEKRFKSVEELSSKELCILMVYGEEEVLTSSFNGLFSRMMEKMKNENVSGNDLMESISASKLVVFARECVSFGHFDELLETMDESHQQKLIVNIVKSIEGNDEQGDLMQNGAAIADIISQLNPQDKIFKTLENEIRSGLIASNQEVFRTGYTDELFAYWTLGLLAANKDSDTTVWPDQFRKFLTLPEMNLDLHTLKTPDLFNENNTNIQQYFFYNDDDGKASFESFLSQYENKTGWVINKNDTFVEINSVGKGRKIQIYANYPETDEEGTDAVKAFLDEKMLTPTIIVHRGHSYHASETINDIQEKVKLVSLGSCGGYNQVSEVLDKSPNAQILSTKGIGTMVINDPLLKTLNEKILSGKEIVWSEFWKTLKMKVGGDKRFEDYIPPDKNQGAIFIKMYEQVKIEVEKMEQ